MNGPWTKYENGQTNNEKKDITQGAEAAIGLGLKGLEQFFSKFNMTGEWQVDR